MNGKFTLARRVDDVTSRYGITPSHGEEMGRELGMAGDALIERVRAKGGNIEWIGHLAIEFWELGAEAYEMGASASLGHARSERYYSAAKDLRAKADRMATEIKVIRERQEDEREARKAAHTD